MSLKETSESIFSCHLRDGYYIKFDSALPTLIPLFLHSILPSSLHRHTLPSSHSDKKKSPTSLSLSAPFHFVSHISLSPFYRIVSELFAYLSSVHCVFPSF